jgi:hypothetical protein
VYDDGVTSRAATAALLVSSLLACDKVKSFASPPAPPPTPPAAPVAAPAGAGAAPQATPDDAVVVFSSNPRAVKDVLSKRVHGEKPSQDDARLLLAVCTNLHDDACIADCQMILGEPPAAPSKPGASAAPAAPSAYDLAKKVATKDPRAARGLLLPRVQSGASTSDEEDLLDQVCKKLKDKDCLKTVSDARRSDDPAKNH